jgi:glycosyltransferase involved in cell wall biosynthesis
MSLPKVSIVIPCRNEEKYIEKCIFSFIDSSFNVNELEILICDGMSTDKTRDIVNQINSKYPQVKLLDNVKQKTPFALNLGIDTAIGEYVLIASAHSSFDVDYIAVLMSEIKTLNADVVGGVMETKVLNENHKTNSIIKVLSNKFGVGNATFRIGIDKPTLVDTVPFGLYKLELLKKVNGYDNRLIRNHDIEMSKRLLALGAKIYLIPNTKCYYYARESISEVMNNNYRNGKWNLKTVFITKRFSSLSLRHFIPLVFVLSLVVPLLFGVLFHTFFYFVALLSLVTYLLAVSFISSKITTKNTNFIYLVLTFLGLHLSYGFGSLVGLFSFFNKK